MNTTAQFDQMIAQFNKMFKQCHDALAADTPQEDRDALRAAIADFLKSPDNKE
jgi:hypothetical protein